MAFRLRPGYQSKWGGCVSIMPFAASNMGMAL